MDKLSSLATPSATRAVLERHGLYTKYALGQNFLVNDGIVRKIVALADVQGEDAILEVGPGIGTLTVALLQEAGHVTAIEMDVDLPKVLAETTAPWDEKFALISANALDVTADDISAAGGSMPTKLVSNLPYAVAATVVLDYFQRFPFLSSATVMVQKEVADRICAKPGSKTYGAYTVKLGLFAQVVGRFPVSPGNFFPPPRVESSVIRLDRTQPRDSSGELIAPAQVECACMMADAAFANRRKTLSNSFKSYFSSLGERGKPVLEHLDDLFSRAQIDPRKRGEVLVQADFIRLAHAFADMNPGFSPVLKFGD